MMHKKVKKKGGWVLNFNKKSVKKESSKNLLDDLDKPINKGSKDAVKLIYVNIFILTLILVLIYVVAKLSNIKYGVLYFIAFIMASIIYFSYKRMERRKKETRHKKVKLHKIEKEKLKRLYSILALTGLFGSILLIIFSLWILFVIVLAISIYLLYYLKKSRKKNIAGKSLHIKHFISDRKWYETDIDKLVEFINFDNNVKLSDIANGFNISSEKAEIWGKMLEEHGLIKIHYPAVGEPIFMTNDSKVKFKDARIILKYITVMLLISALFGALLIIKIFVLK